MPQATSTKTTFDISLSTIIKIALVIFGIYFLYLVLDIIALLFVAVIVAAAFGPWVDWFQRRRIPRPLGVVFIYLIIFLLIASIIFLIIPPLVEQIRQLATALPNYYGKAVIGLQQLQGSTNFDATSTIKSALDNLGSSLARATTSIFTTINSIFGGLIQLVVILVISFYLIVQENGLKRFMRSVTPAKYQPYLMQLMSRIHIKIGLWFRAQLLLMLVIFAVTYLGLWALQMDYVLALALWAGLTEIIPYVGPIIGALPAIFLAFTISPTMGLLVILLYVVVQQLENNILVPTIMRKAVGLNPIISILVILIGAKVGGVVGAILSIPIATVAAVFLSDFFEGWRGTVDSLVPEEEKAPSAK
ncbi:MAG: AI-2E family transporter [Patescibacteria group bacterium]